MQLSIMYAFMYATKELELYTLFRNYYALIIASPEMEDICPPGGNCAGYDRAADMGKVPSHGHWSSRVQALR